MIVPMKKVSLIVLSGNKRTELKKLRKLGMMHIEVLEGTSKKLTELQTETELLQNAIYTIGKTKGVEQKPADCKTALSVAKSIVNFSSEKETLYAKSAELSAELERLKDWGEFDPATVLDLVQKGVNLSFYEMPIKEYAKLPENIKTVKLCENKSSVRFVVLNISEFSEDLKQYKLTLPQKSTAEMRNEIDTINAQCNAIDKNIMENGCYADSLKNALKCIDKEIEFELCANGTVDKNLTENKNNAVSITQIHGFIEAENLPKLKEFAKDNAWGLIVDDPTEGDNAPTKLKNNKFVSLVYPLTDFLGTVPGYFEYDISGWFLAFILIFFGIIFGDGGYGLLITAGALIPIVKSLIFKKSPSATALLVGLFGLSTVVWGTLTCTWFGLTPAQLPTWLKSLSVPVISNVYADKIWHPFWTTGEVGLTTAQNLQIFCFSLALVQLTVAHIKGAIRNKKTIKVLGDIGSILQLFGIFYLVLSLVVNADVFSFSLVLYGIPVGTVAISLISVGFILSFVFSNFNGSIVKSILCSLQNIVSVLLGVVNVFSDIVSYIRLWAVGLAGAAISATVNELASPLLGNFMFMIIAIVLLVFGHGLNMILNVLSVIVHGIRLNTLEFSSHLDMSWSGHKFKPFKEQID